MLITRVVATLAAAVSVGGGWNDVGGGSYNRIVSIDKFPICAIDSPFDNSDAGGGSNAVFVAMSPLFQQEDGGGVDNSTLTSFDVADISFNDDTTAIVDLDGVSSDVNLNVTSPVTSPVTSLGCNDVGGSYNDIVSIDKFPIGTDASNSSFNNGPNAAFFATSPFDNEDGGGVGNSTSTSFDVADISVHIDAPGLLDGLFGDVDVMTTSLDVNLNLNLNVTPLRDVNLDMTSFTEEFPYNTVFLSLSDNAVGSSIPDPLSSSTNSTSPYTHDSLGIIITYGFHREHMEWKYDRVFNNDYCRRMYFGYYRWWKPFCRKCIVWLWLFIPVVPSEHPPEDVYGAEFGARVRRQIHNEHLFLGVIRYLAACLGMMAFVIDVPAVVCWLLLYLPAIFSLFVKFPKRVRDNFLAMYLYLVKNTIKSLFAAVMCIPSILLEFLYSKANGTGSTIGLMMSPVVVMERLGYAMCQWCDGCFDSIIMKMLCLRSPVKAKHLRHRSGKSRRRPSSSSRSSSEPSSEPSSSARASTMPSSTQLLGCGILLLLMMKILSSYEASCRPFTQLLGCGILLLLLLMKILSWMLLSTQQESSTQYKRGERVMYSKDGISFTMATVLEVHLDDHLRPYYVVQVDGKEIAVDTIGSNLSPLSKLNWGRLLDIATYWLVLSCIGSYSSSILKNTVKVFSALAIYRSCAQHRMYIFLLCCFSWSSFVQAVDAESGDEDGFYGAHFGGYNYEDNQGWKEEQSNAFEHAMGLCLKIAVDLFNSNQLFVPSPEGKWFPMVGAFALDKLAQLGETSNSVIYAFTRKVGHAWDGKVRKKWYQNVTERIFVVFDLDHQRGDDHRNLIASIINFCKQCCSGITPQNLAGLTIATAIEMEKTGLPFCACLFFYSIAHSASECNNLGGSKATCGYLRRLILSCVESGVQRLFPELGIKLETNSMPHEFVTGYGLMDWVKASHENCVNCGAAFFKKLKDTFGDLDSSSDGRVNYDGSFIDYVLKNGIQMIALSSWAPNIKCLPLTEVILDLMFGSWSDAFGDLKPPEDKPYDAGSYKDGDRNFAFDNFIAFVKRMEEAFASFGALDTNEEMLRASKAVGRTLVQILEERGWKVFFSFADFGLDIDVYYYQKEDGYWPSFIFIHGPPCFAFNTESTKLTKTMIDLMRKRVVELHFLFLFSRKFLKEVMSDGFNVSRDLQDYTVLYNLLMAHAMFQYLVANFHLNTKYVCIFAKNMLVPFNAFLADITVESTRYINGIYCDNNNNGLVSRAARREATQTTSSDQTRDKHYVQTILNIITRCFTSKCPLPNVMVLTEEECYSQVVELLKAVKDKAKRWKHFKERNVIVGPLLKGLTRAWDRSAVNAKPAAQNKIDEAQQRMQGKTGWPDSWPTGLGWDKSKSNWKLKKMVHGIRVSWRFDDNEEGLLDAVKVKTRFDEMKESKNNLLKAAATKEEKDRLRNVMNQHCRVTEGQSCLCAWCKDLNANSNKRRRL